MQTFFVFGGGLLNGLVSTNFPFLNLSVHSQKVLSMPIKKENFLRLKEALSMPH